MNEESLPLSPVQRDRIYLAEMWQNQASYKAKGWKAYYLSNGTLYPLTVNRCLNQWGKIYLLTDAEAHQFYHSSAPAVTALRESITSQLALVNELVESMLVHNIIKP